jgi:hypothetical protein
MFRRLTFYKDSSQTGGAGKPTDKTFIINTKNIETVVTYSDHSKVTMVSGKCLWVCELEEQIIQMA